jgi:hypothetical protein
MLVWFDKILKTTKQLNALPGNTTPGVLKEYPGLTIVYQLAHQRAV